MKIPHLWMLCVAVLCAPAAHAQISSDKPPTEDALPLPPAPPPSLKTPVIGSGKKKAHKPAATFERKKLEVVYDAEQRIRFIQQIIGCAQNATSRSQLSACERSEQQSIKSLRRYIEDANQHLPLIPPEFISTTDNESGNAISQPAQQRRTGVAEKAIPPSGAGEAPQSSRNAPPYLQQLYEQKTLKP